MINVSIVTYAGLSYGGAHQQSMKIARLLNKDKFNVTYFWCKHNKDKYSDFKFPELNLGFVQDLEEHGVKCVEFTVGYRDISCQYHTWKNTDFFEKFDQVDTDIVFCVKSGHPEFPFNYIYNPIIEWNVFGSYDDTPTLVKSVGSSYWVSKQRGHNTGTILYGVDYPKSHRSLVTKCNKITLGFHQRVDDGIYGEHALNAWKWCQDNTKNELRFIILGGSEKYKEQAKRLGLNVTFIPVTSDRVEVSKFLNSLDIWTHAAGCGESMGIAVMEAMMHGLPVVSKTGIHNGHLDLLDGVISIAHCQLSYNNLLLSLINNDNYRQSVAVDSRKRATEQFSNSVMIKKFEALFEEFHKKKFYGTLKPKYNILRKYIYRLLYTFGLLEFVIKLRRRIKNR